MQLDINNRLSTKNQDTEIFGIPAIEESLIRKEEKKTLAEVSLGPLWQNNSLLKLVKWKMLVQQKILKTNTVFQLKVFA